MRLLDDLLAAGGAKALAVLAESSRDPLLAPFAGPARLGSAALIAAAGRPPLLAYFSPMERGEAARSGLALLTPEALDIPRWQRDGAGPVALWHGVLEQALARAGLSPGRLALAGHLDAGVAVAVAERLAGDGWSFVPGDGMVLRLRKRKSAAELDELRRVASGTADAFYAVAAALATAGVAADGTLEVAAGRPLTVGGLRARIAETLARRRLEQPEGNLVAPGEEGAVPHNQGSDARALRAGESLIVDLFPRGRLFADCTRTFCVGSPPEALAAAHADVAAALACARAGAVGGARGWDLQVAVCELLEARGHATPVTDHGTVEGYVHGLGHGVGYEVHEQPSFRQHAGEDGVLEIGDVFTLEPGLYQPEAGWAVRLEDTVALAEDGGLEVLTELPYELDPARWPAR